MRMWVPGGGNGVGVDPERKEKWDGGRRGMVAWLEGRKGGEGMVNILHHVTGGGFTLVRPDWGASSLP